MDEKALRGINDNLLEILLPPTLAALVAGLEKVNDLVGEENGADALIVRCLLLLYDRQMYGGEAESLLAEYRGLIEDY